MEVLMGNFLLLVGVGVVLLILGAIHMTGNISSLHRYHRKRVTEENRKPFGRLVGLGTTLVGISIILYGAMLFAFEKTQMDGLMIAATAILILGIVTGLGLSFYAMIKYNKGIF